MDVLMFITASCLVVLIGASIYFLVRSNLQLRMQRRYSTTLSGTAKNRRMQRHVLKVTSGGDASHVSSAPFSGQSMLERALEWVQLLPRLPWEDSRVIKAISAKLTRHMQPTIRSQASHILAWHIVFSLACCLVSCGFQHIEVGLVIVLATFLLPYMWSIHIKKKERQLMRTQMVEFLDSLSDSLKANKSLGQAFQNFCVVSKKPLKPIVEKTVALMACGIAADQAFCEASKSVEIQEIQALGTALQIQYKTGGNLNNLLAEFSNHFRESILFEQNLQAQTAQGRLSVRVVSVVPPLLIVVMNLIVPGYFSSFLSYTLGRILFGLALILNLIGLVLVKRIMTLSVEL